MSTLVTCQERRQSLLSVVCPRSHCGLSWSAQNKWLHLTVGHDKLLAVHSFSWPPAGEPTVMRHDEMSGQEPIKFDDLHYTASHIFELGGVAYTGVAEEVFEDGAVRCRHRFLDGQLHGDAEEFYESGAKKSITPYLNGVSHGRTIEWYEQGVVHIERDNEYGILIRCREFDHSGKLIDEYLRPDDDPMMEHVQKLRRKARIKKSRN